MLIASMFKHWVVVKKNWKAKIDFHDVHIMLLTLISYRKYNKSWIFFTIIIPPIILSTYYISLIDFVTFWGFFFWLFSRLLSARTIKSKKVQFQKVSYAIFFVERTVVGWRLLNLPLHFFSRVIIDFLFGLLGNLPPPLPSMPTLWP